MKIYRISIGLIIPLHDNICLYRSHNNKWYIEKFGYIGYNKEKVETSFDILKPKGKRGALITLFKDWDNG